MIVSHLEDLEKLFALLLILFWSCLNPRALYGRKTSLLENLCKCLLVLIVCYIISWT